MNRRQFFAITAAAAMTGKGPLAVSGVGIGVSNPDAEIHFGLVSAGSKEFYSDMKSHFYCMSPRRNVVFAENNEE